MTLSIVIPSYNARELLRRALSVNLGIEASTGDYVLLLNSDLFLTQEALVSMIERLSANPQVGAVAPSLHNEDGSRQLSFGLFGGLYWPNWLAVKKPSSVPLVSFACVMTRRDALTRLGALDENFFLYNEEYDWLRFPLLCEQTHVAFHRQLAAAGDARPRVRPQTPRSAHAS